ncbi:MAG: hypothetical protein MH112_14530 [Phenylobacterium sp.]|uniref:hypothetical protein n=1 Tax=Phenylobacterium sp. TaxID=1871053 RepID=UPI0025E709C6|nr:hypothetical protein [Phenylobacterium sp.]MCG9917558.1 hypothetical protein [Phenylobacterium sp.]
MSYPMGRTIERLKYIFAGVFALCLVGIFAYQAHVVWPQERCEAQGDWWDPDGRVCARPVLISDITGRTIPERQAAEAAAAEAATSAPVP